MSKPFVSGLYRPEEDARNQPLRNIQHIVDDAQRNKPRNALRRRYRTRSMDRPVEMAGIRRATNRMVGSE